MNDGAVDLAQSLIEVTKELTLHCSEINPETVRVLSDMYTASFLNGTESDKPIKISKIARIGIHQGAQMHKIMRSRNVRRSLEIGFLYGFSTVWILDALSAQRDNLHVAIDPFEKTDVGGIGLYQIGRLPYVTKFEWIEDYSIHALSNLIKQNMKFEFIFIDGNHRFDNVLVDFYLSDLLLSVGGLIVFDDMWMDSVRTVVNFVRTNRQYDIVTQPNHLMVVLEKKANDDRTWRHFEPFEVHSDLRRDLRLRLKDLTYNLCQKLRDYTIANR